MRRDKGVDGERSRIWNPKGVDGERSRIWNPSS